MFALFYILGITSGMSYKYNFKFTAVKLESILLKPANLALCLQVDSAKAGKKSSKIMFKDNNIELTTKLLKDGDSSFARKNVIYLINNETKAILGQGKLIAQSVCNLAEVVYLPERGKFAFEQKLSLKFHKSFTFSNILKQHAALNLLVTSVLVKDCDDNDMSCLTERKTVSKRQYLTNTDEKIIFDIDETINTDNDFESFCLEDSSALPSQWMNELSVNSCAQNVKSNKNKDDALSNRSLSLTSQDFDNKIMTALNGNGRNEYKMNIKSLSNKSNNVSYDTYNSSNHNQNTSQGLDVHSELNLGNISDRSFREKENNYYNMIIAQLKDQLTNEKANIKLANDKIEGFLLQKSELIHKISQLQSQVKESEQENNCSKSDFQSLKSKYEELISLQYAGDSQKLNALAGQLEQKDEEIKNIISEKSIEIQQLKTFLDAKQSQISKTNVLLETKDNKIKTLEKQIKSLENELKSKSKVIASFEVSSKSEIDNSQNEKSKEIIQLKHELSIKSISISKRDQQISELKEENENCKKSNKTLQDTIEDLKKLSNETVEMYKTQLYQKESEINSIKKDIESQKNRIYTAVNEIKSQMKEEIVKRDVAIEKMKSTIEISDAKGRSSMSTEKHWVIESNLRDIISELKQKLMNEQAKRERIEKDLEIYSELLVKTKAEWANCEHEKEVVKFQSLKLEEELEEIEDAYDELLKENEKLIKQIKKS